MGVDLEKFYDNIEQRVANYKTPFDNQVLKFLIQIITQQQLLMLSEQSIGKVQDVVEADYFKQ